MLQKAAVVNSSVLSLDLKVPKILADLVFAALVPKSSSSDEEGTRRESRS